MKRIFIIFALISAFALPAQMAEANSFSTTSNLLEQIQSITGKNASNLMGRLPSGKTFDIAVLFASSESDPFAGAGSQLGGLNVLLGVTPSEFFSSVEEVYASSGDAVAYEYNGGTVALTGGTIFVSTHIDNVGYVFALSPSNKGSFNPVPLPAAVVMFSSGLVGLVALRRKMK